MSVLKTFDEQLAKYGSKLCNDLRIDKVSSPRLATKIYDEISALPAGGRDLIVRSSPVPPRDRLHQIEQSIAFNAACGPQIFARVPGVAYAHTITLCYISVVYLAESLFDAVHKALGPNSSGRKCAGYLRNNPVRAFRNALAHGHWRFRGDGSAIEFWARKGSAGSDPMVLWEVSQDDLVFWYGLSHATGYAALKAIVDHDNL